MEVVTNRNFLSKPIANENEEWPGRAVDYAKHIGKSVVTPMGVESFIQGPPEGSGIGRAQRAFGFREAPGWAANPEAFEVMMRKIHGRDWKQKIHSDNRQSARYTTDLSTSEGRMKAFDELMKKMF
jgi:hypothetical protein